MYMTAIDAKRLLDRVMFDEGDRFVRFSVDIMEIMSTPIPGKHKEDQLLYPGLFAMFMSFLTICIA